MPKKTDIEKLIPTTKAESKSQSDKKLEALFKQHGYDPDSPKVESDSVTSLDYRPISEEQLLKFHEFQGVINIITQLKENGFNLETEDEKRIFDYVISNRESVKKAGFLDRLSKDLELRQVKRKIEPRLFGTSNLSKTSTSLVLDTIVAVMVGRTVVSEKTHNKHFYRKGFKIGEISIVLDLALEALQKQYGIEDGLESIKVLQVLLSYWYAKRDLSEKILVSGNDILGYLDMKYKNNRGTRCKKYENLGWLLNHCRLLRSIYVCSGGKGINPKNKKPFSFGQETHLIEMNLTYTPIQINIDGAEDLDSVKDLIIEFKAGDWFKYFDNPDPKGLRQYGYLHKDSLFSRGMKSALLTVFPVKLRQTQSGLFTIRKILEESGYNLELEAILTEPDYTAKAVKAANFKREFDKAVKDIQIIDDPYTINYRNAPEWATTRKRKPDNWFSQWLDLTLHISEPKCLEAKEFFEEKYKQKKEEKQPKTKLSVKDIESTLELYRGDRRVSIRKITVAMYKKHPWLQKRLDPCNDLYGKLTQSEIKDCLKAITYLAK